VFEGAGFSRNAGVGRPSRWSGGASESRMNKPASDPTQPYRSLIAAYTDAIRQCDFKANIAFLFVEFMMGPILWNYTSLPSYLAVQIVLLPFLIVYFCCFMVLLPRFPKLGAKNLLVSRNLTPADFDNVAETEGTIEQLKLRCAVLSDILWWKSLFIRVGFLLSIVCVFLTLLLLFYVWYFGAHAAGE
jgi:hypothetical protein